MELNVHSWYCHLLHTVQFVVAAVENVIENAFHWRVAWANPHSPVCCILSSETYKATYLLHEGFTAQTGGTRATGGRRRLRRCWLEAFDFVLVTFRAQALLHRVAIETASILAQWRWLRLHLGISSISVHCWTPVVERHFLHMKEKIITYWCVHLTGTKKPTRP